MGDVRPGATGAGTLGTGPAVPGGDRQEFDFDLDANLAGRVFYRDWVVDRTLSVDADTMTQITAFRNESSLCAAPTRGVEVDGTGRLGSGGYVGFTLVACDDGAAGGTDRLTMTTTTGPGRNGLLTSGDIVKWMEEPPTAGDLVIATETRGSGIPGRYRFTSTGPGGPPRGYQSTWETRTYPGVPPGTYTVELFYVPSNCTVSEGTIRTFDVPAGGTGRAFYSITCVSPPATAGDLLVETTTSGPTSGEFSPYFLTVDGNQRGPVGFWDTATFAYVAEGAHTVVISGVPSNCTVSGGLSRTVTVPAGGVGTTSYAIACTNAPPPTTGDLTVTTSTSGSALPSGYTVSVDGGPSQSIGVNASFTFAALTAGDHTVTLAGVPTNCTLGGEASRVVSVPAGATATASYSVSCVAPTGDLTVTTNTTGSDLPSSFSASVDGQSRPIAANGTATFEDLAAGSHTVVLSGLPSNCSVAGGASRMVDVPSGGATTVAYSVTCTPIARELVFTQQPPRLQPLLSTFTVAVTAVDVNGQRVTSFTGPVTISIERDGSVLGNARLIGTTTVNAIDGVATFELRVDQIGLGYTLRAGAPELSHATSDEFAVVF
jgi:hypothetical protein